jgi:hypothetical protein
MPGENRFMIRPYDVWQASRPFFNVAHSRSRFTEKLLHSQGHSNSMHASVASVPQPDPRRSQ